ncbi:MAG TPA: CBS domain-containing protein [bacterium (Candidatus Stahlbacteria)]|nr:CBS domain-containing protein [Candidatus Stahlbacteria bacterium]
MEKVKEIMTKNVIALRENDTLLEAAEVFKENRIVVLQF